MVLSYRTSCISILKCVRCVALGSIWAGLTWWLTSTGCCSSPVLPSSLTSPSHGHKRWFTLTATWHQNTPRNSRTGPPVRCTPRHWGLVEQVWDRFCCVKCCKCTPVKLLPNDVCYICCWCKVIWTCWVSPFVSPVISLFISVVCCVLTHDYVTWAVFVSHSVLHLSFLLGKRSGDVRVVQLPYSPSLTTPLLVDTAGKEAKDKQRRERAREQLLKINQRKKEEKVLSLSLLSPPLSPISHSLPLFLHPLPLPR